jgi:HlyD family secretion protein
MRLPIRAIILGGLGAVVLGGLVAVAIYTPPVPADLYVATRGPMAVTVEAEGETRVRDIYEIAAPVAGVARRAPVEAGDPVIAGQTVVAEVDSGIPAFLDDRARVQAEAAIREAEAAIDVARSERRQAEEDLSYASTQHDRVQRLVERGATSLTRLEDASQVVAVKRAALETAQSRLAMAENALDRARAMLIEPGADGDGDGPCCLEITAPIDGVVLSVAVESERPVAAGTPLVAVGDLADMEIVADVLSADAVRLPAGAPARVLRWGGEGALAARLDRVAPVARSVVSALGIEEQRADAIFTLVSPPADRPGLGHGYAVWLEIVVWRGEDVLQVPVSALFRRDGDWAVFVVDPEGRARERAVTLGRRAATMAEIRQGLSAGDRVILHPGIAITDGTRIVDRAEVR